MRWLEYLPLIVCVVLASAAHSRPHPADLTGVWSNASLTDLERATGQSRLVVSAEEAAKIVQDSLWMKHLAQDAAPTDPAEGAPTDGNVTPPNAFWADRGTHLAKVKGEYRTSWIVDPTDGRLPLTSAGQKARLDAAATRDRSDPEGPEDLSPNDRCLISSRGSGGPGMLNNLYNNNYQILQTPDAVLILVEMVHDARIIPVFPTRLAASRGHRPAALRPWLGDSVGWWEGAAFVVETTNVNPQQGRFGPIFLSQEGRVLERFTRTSPTELLYEFEVHDPIYYARTWRAETTLTASPGGLYEYACHEGNYALRGVLGGARAEQRERSRASPKP